MDSVSCHSVVATSGGGNATPGRPFDPRMADIGQHSRHTNWVVVMSPSKPLAVMSSLHQCINRIGRGESCVCVVYSLLI